MSALYPLRFHPILRRYLWGGRRLESLGKQLDTGEDYAESWEVVDHGQDQSVVAHGPLAGATLNAIVARYPRELFGRHASYGQFPLLFKFLDANDRLSMQVHPDDARARRLTPPDLGKTEAWVILAAEPGSYLYAGLRRGVDRALLEREVQRRTCELCTQRIEPEAGDCFFLPAGVIHALGPGLLVAEIQQASDTTYRLYDWNRTGPDGTPRQLHIEEALEAIDYDYGPVSAQKPEPIGEPGVERLVKCDKFVLERRTIRGSQRIITGERCHIVSVIDGAIEIKGDHASRPLERGDVALVPAECEIIEMTASGEAYLLDAYLP